MKKRWVAMLAAGAMVLSSVCAGLGTVGTMEAAAAPADGGTVVYVDAANGDDGNDGSLEAPVQTLAKAQELARGLAAGMSSDVTVCLRGGLYVLDSPLVFDASDSGQNGFTMVWTGYEGEEAVISGGTEITGWTLYDADRDIWAAPAQGVASRDLYVNGERALFSRSPQVSVKDVSSFFNRVTLNKSLLPDTFAHPEDIELVARQTEYWTVLPAASVKTDDEYHAITLEQAALDSHRAIARGETADEEDLRDKYVLFVQNDYELIDEPGEWYLDKGADTVYYKPREGEDMTAVSARLGRLESLFELRGVQNFRLSGLTFADTTWLQGDKPEGVVCARQGTYLDGSGPENYPDGTIAMDGMNAVYGESLDHVEITDNKFRNLGGNAVFLEKAIKNATITGNDLYDIAACGITVGGGRAECAEPENLVEDNLIRGNTISKTGAMYQQAAAISIGYAARTTVEYNTIDGIHRTGISVGSWLGTSWAFRDEPTDEDDLKAKQQREAMRERDQARRQELLENECLTTDNRIAHNRILNLTYETTWNCYGIYCLGRMDRTVITGNYIDMVQGSGIALKRGACGFVVTNNAEPNVQNSVENEGDYVWAYNNYFGETNEANGARDTPKNEPKALGEEAVTYFENNELWDDAAVEALREASGVEGMNVSYTDPEPEMHPEVGSAPAAEPETTAEETTAEETTAEETTAAPTTEAPTTAAPTTEAPTTAAPTTAAPAASTGTQATESGGIGVLPIVLIVAIVCVAAGIVVYLKKKGKTDSK